MEARTVRGENTPESVRAQMPSEGLRETPSAT